MAGVGGYVDGGRELSEIEQKQPLLGRLIRRALDGVNTLAKNTATSATGESAPPHPPSGATVSVAGELAHITINHPGTIQRGINYITEIHSDDPATIGRPIVLDHRSSRTPPPVNLPTFRPNPDDPESPIKINYSTVHYAQYQASQPSSLVAGRMSDTGATTFQMAGATVMSLLPGNGSGTGPNTGLGGQGLGKVQQRGQ